MWGLVNALGNAVFGPTPVVEAMTLSREVLLHVKGHPGHEADASLLVAQLESMRGNVETARAKIAHARSLFRELGHTHSLASMTDAASEVERDAGDVLAAERERRSGYRAFRSMGAVAFQATWAAWLADLLVLLDREDEALDLAREVRAFRRRRHHRAGPVAHGQAKVLARQGDGAKAWQLAEEAVQIAHRTDWLNLQGDAHMALAEVLRLAGRQGDAAEAAGHAVDRFEEKGNVVSAARARGLLEELAAPTQP